MIEPDAATQEDCTVTASTDRSPTSTDPLVQALEARLRVVDLVGWAQITARAEQHGLSFEDLRLLLALAARDGTSNVGDLARLSGLSTEAAHRGVNHLRGRGYLREERCRYALSVDGQELVGVLDTAHREGIQAYVEGLDARERQVLEAAMRPT